MLSNKQQLASVSPQPPYLWLSSPRSGTSSSQPRFTSWLCLGISKPRTNSSHHRLLYRSDRVALGKTQVGADLGLYYLGNPRTSIPSGQLQMTMEYYHSVPAELILHGGQRFVFIGHSQSLQLTGLGKSLPLICQQQPGSTRRGGCTQPTQSVHPKYPAWVMGRLCHWALQDTYYTRPHYQDRESKQLY